MMFASLALSDSKRRIKRMMESPRGEFICCAIGGALVLALIASDERGAGSELDATRGKATGLARRITSSSSAERWRARRAGLQSAESSCAALARQQLAARRDINGVHMGVSESLPGRTSNEIIPTDKSPAYK